MATVERRSDFNLNLLGEAFAVPVQGFEACSVQAVLYSGTWATAVVSVQVSNDGVDYAAMPSPVNLPTGGGITSVFNVWGYAYVRVVVTTVEGAAGIARVSVRMV